MTIFLENANDVVLSNVRLNLDEDQPIEHAEFTCSLGLQNTLGAIVNVSSHVTEPTITLTGDIGLEVGDTVLIRRVRGAINVNGFHEVVSVSGNDITISANTGVQTFEGGGKVWKVILPPEEFTYREETQEYYVVLRDTLQLIPNQKYLVFIENEDLEVRVEFEDTAQIRRQ